MSREELMVMKKSELKAMCKERNIPVYRGKNLITNPEMVDRILEHDAAAEVVSEVTEQEKVEVEVKEKEQETKQEQKKRFTRKPVNPVISPEIKEEIENSITEQNQVEITPWVMGGKDDIINETEPGTLIAFLDNNGKPRTAKLVHRSASRRMLELVTEFDWKFVVSYDNVLWVRRGTRWPKAVYLMLKGYKYGKSAPVIYEK